MSGRTCSIDFLAYLRTIVFLKASLYHRQSWMPVRYEKRAFEYHMLVVFVVQSPWQVYLCPYMPFACFILYSCELDSHHRPRTIKPHTDCIWCFLLVALLSWYVHKRGMNGSQSLCVELYLLLEKSPLKLNTGGICFYRLCGDTYGINCDARFGTFLIPISPWFLITQTAMSGNWSNI